MEIVNNLLAELRPILETVNLIASITIAGCAIYALKQIALLKESISVQSKRDALKLTGEQCTNYMRHIIPLQDELNKSIEENKITYFEGRETDQDTRYSLLLDGKRIEPTGELKYLNHSCNPNAYFSDRWLVASRDISIGDEITIDYFATENMISYPFICHCGAENCRDKKKMARTATPLNINNNVVHPL